MKKIMLLLSIALLLVACSEETSEKQQLTDALAAINEKESQSLSVVKKLNQQEEKEQKIFTQTMELTQEQYPEVKKQVASLKKSSGNRMEMIEKEETALSEAKDETNEVDELMKVLKPKDKKTVDKMLGTLEERYILHEKFIMDYKKLIDAQTQLYTQLEDREVRASQLQRKVKEINGLAVAIQQSIDEFNESTAEVNRLGARVLESLEEAK
ncbi:YkyA family protein [Sporosarcina cascadiensis]|uniref:YkyA family protein n=1 Tax=Sporosarcina cascadiensis TaxID=2660747 RepID=UPI001890EFBE|nr:YkyA family protein [Sporosarcina cascadiensis]GKV66050.1 hypothetical protein NCCP2331_22030 [Sporosarcina sp. NCCP-2331]GLB56524.1 hypothetical protein NCCP2378_23110 [Sporosarcina sp. NCCP-2378]